MQPCIPRILPPATRRAIGSMDLRSNVLHWPTMELKKCSRGSLRAKQDRNWAWNAWSSSSNPSTSPTVSSNGGMEHSSPCVRHAGNICGLLREMIGAFGGSVGGAIQHVKAGVVVGLILRQHAVHVASASQHGGARLVCQASLDE